MIKIKKNKLYLVTGGSGFLGVPLCKRILDAGGKVRTIARDEGKLIDSWGKGEFVRPHGIYIDHEDTLYLVDDGGHFLKKCTNHMCV